MAISDGEILNILYELAGTQPYNDSRSHVTTKEFEPSFDNSKKPEFVLDNLVQYKKKK
jgi:hypothetical protein